MKRIWIHATIMFAAMCCGCMSSFTGEISKMLDNPGVQATLQNWSARGRAINPSAEAYMKVSYGVCANGVEAQGEIAGDKSGGIDPDKYAALIETMKRRGYDPSTEPSVLKWIAEHAMELVKP